MKEKLKGSDVDSSADAAEHARRAQPGAQRPKAGKSGEAKEEKLEQNRDRLNVGPDHKTPEMKKGHRGTFP
jgi:hypothetical protein